MTATTAINQSKAQKCIDACGEVLRVVSRCVAECLRRDASGMAECIRLCLDCGALCGACLDLVSRDSRFAAPVCAACAEACSACADECERVGGGDGVMRQCAYACRRCAEVCRQMA